jgi:plasmid rolling circle replication initiator protein Rep
VTKIIKKETRYKKRNPDTTLDTLEVTSDFFKSKHHESLYYSTSRKASTITTLTQLIDVSNRVWNKKYWQAYHCRNILLQDGDKLRGSLCRKRWCQCCNRIKTAELIKGYSKPLQELQKDDSLYFVTLTTKTVKAGKLRSEIEKRYKAITRIKDNLRKNYGVKLTGARKLEVTYNERTNEYHPHYHFIVKGNKEAKLLLELWLKQFPNASDLAQDIREIDAKNESNLVEVFKYATKGAVKDNKTAIATHNIYVALEGKRVFQTYGSLRKVKEETEAKEEITNADFVRYGYDIWQYDIDEKDYFNSYNNKLVGTKEIDAKKQLIWESRKKVKRGFNQHLKTNKKTRE